MCASSSAAQIVSIATTFSSYSTITTLALGLIGNLLNILVLVSLKVVRKSSYAFHLTIESLVNTFLLILLSVIRLTSWLTVKVDPANSFLAWCKLRTAIAQPLVLLSCSIVCFAAFDQYLCTQHQIRIKRLSTHRLAQRMIAIFACAWPLHSILFAIFLHIRSTSGCGVYNPMFNEYYNYFYYPVLSGALPMSISTAFSLLAFRNVRRLVRRQVPVVRRHVDRQLTAMVLLRVVFFVLLLFPFTLYRVYSVRINPQRVSLIQAAIEQLILTIVFAMYNLNFAASFYIFFLSSMRFRRQVKAVLVKRLHRQWRRFFSLQLNQVHPSSGIPTGSMVDEQ